MTWLSQIRASFKIDAQNEAAGQKPASRAHSNSSASTDPINEVDRKLKADMAASCAPESLHISIMGAVRSSVRRPPRIAELPPLWRRAPALASFFIVCLLAGIFFLAPRPETKNPARNLKQELVALPDTVISPLSNELGLLQQDFEKTASFLLASVPEIAE